MNKIPGNHSENSPAADVIAIHLLKTMTTHQREGRMTSLDDLAETLEIRRADVRRVLSALHRQGLVDVMRMRLTIAGFAIGQAVANEELLPLRPVVELELTRRAA